MPYRIEAGTEVYLEMKNGAVSVTKLNRTVDFTKKELVESPLEEHWGFGISAPRDGYWQWCFDVYDKWTKGTDAETVSRLSVAANDVKIINTNTSKKAKTVTVQGSGSNVHTVTLDENDTPVSCSCPGYRFKRAPCKHMRSIK